MQLQKANITNINNIIFNQVHHLPGSYGKELYQILTETKCFVAGGFALWILQRHLAGFHDIDVRSPSDLDVFFYSEEDFQKALQIATLSNAVNTSHTEPYFGESTRAVTYRSNGEKVQLIKMRYGDPEMMLATFDFEISKVCFQMNSVTKEFELFHAPLVPELCKISSIKYFGNEVQFLDKEWTEEETKAAVNRLNRISKYLSKATSFYDEESKASLLESIMILTVGFRSSKQFNKIKWILVEIFRKLAQKSNFTKEDAILFVPLDRTFVDMYNEEYVSQRPFR